MVSQIFKKHGLRLDVTVSECLVGCYKDFPIIKASSWVEVLDRRNYLHHLLGLGDDCKTLEAAGERLLEFWRKYEVSHGDHEVFKLASEGALPLRQSIPIYMHGDEGTTYKRDGALVLSFYSPLGQGVACKRSGQLDTTRSLEMNFLGHCFKTRFIMATMLKAG